ncbi:MAG: 4Fe-4S binding protein [Candidatus Marinimicrobia bacterium]|nr:4Fe-4S binding protein [Candidatus Neomarinimicrobiota bacterium]
MNYKKLILIRKLVQLAFLGLLIISIAVSVYPFKLFFLSKIFVIFDPLNLVGPLFASRYFNPILLLSIIILLSPIIFGRAFCGWICPLGTTIDIVDNIIKRERTTSSIKTRKVKYLALIFFISIALFGYQLSWYFDPIPIVWRSYAILILPVFYSIIGSIPEFFISINLLPEFFYSIFDKISTLFFPINAPSFTNLMVPFLIFITILLLNFISKRFWCRNLCPLGALLGFISRFSILKRKVDETCTNCSLCKKNCKMDAINADYISTDKSECILCLNCTEDCPKDSISFKFTSPFIYAKGPSTTRRAVLKFGIFSVIGAGILKVSSDRTSNDRLIRPPGAVKEDQFRDLCIRCGGCIRACSTSGGCLQFSILTTGVTGFMTPRNNYNVGYCEYECNLCGNVCPTGAIRPLSIDEKKEVKMGTAVIQKDRCIPYRLDDNCIVCEEHCPVPEKAIKLERKTVFNKQYNRYMEVYYPYVIPELCIGCGICEYKCPIDGEPGIIVIREGERRYST